MKNFMMRGVILVALLSSLVLPASAADWSNQDSLNLSNIKSYTSDIRTAVTSGALFTNVSAIKASVANISSNVASIYTQVQAVANSTSTISSKVDNIYTALGYNSSYSSRKVIPLLYNVSEYLRTIDEDTSTLRTTLQTFQSNVNGSFDTVTSNQSVINNNLLAFKTAFSSYAGDSSHGVLGYLSSLVSTSETLATENTLQTLVTGESFSEFSASALEGLGYIHESLGTFFVEFMMSMTNQGSGDIDTMYGMMNRLVDVLASDTDKEIRDSQDDNVSQIKQDFVSGSSSGTSLGASDFGSLSSVGSTAKDAVSLNGQASVDTFTSGLSDSDEVARGWFHQNTKTALDNVPTSSSVSRAPARDSDPYNMGDFLSHYDWVFGGAIE